MPPTFETVVADALNQHSRQIAAVAQEVSDGLAALAQAQLAETHRRGALERAFQTVLAQIALADPDPLMFLDRVRRTAQDPLGQELQGMGDEMERLLTKVQAAVIDAQRQAETGKE